MRESSRAVVSAVAMVDSCEGDHKCGSPKAKDGSMTDRFPRDAGIFLF